MARQDAEVELWRVVGGADRGGILVRKFREIGSEKEEERLSTGALVAELELVHDRLRYLLLQGSGPAQGWVGLRLPGKVLVDKAYSPRAMRNPVEEPQHSQGGLPSFHTAGDSHCLAAWPPYVVPHRYIGLLCYNVSGIQLRHFDPPLQAGDALCFSLGEIDCRAHVGKHCIGARTYQDVIDELIERYFAYLQALPQELRLRVFVFNVLPPCRGDHKKLDPEDDGEELQGVRDDWGFSWAKVVCDRDHLAYVLYFNARLRAECARAGFTFFDVYDDYADKEGFMHPDATNDDLHITEGGPIERVLSSLGPWDRSLAKGETARTIDKFLMGTVNPQEVKREMKKRGLINPMGFPDF